LFQVQNKTIGFPDGPVCSIAVPENGCGGRLVLMLLPEGLEDDVASWMESAARRHGCAVAALCGMDWNNDLTPWPAPGVFKKAKPFEGRAEEFLTRLTDVYLPSIRQASGTSHATLLGISLSGLFAIWASFRTDAFDSVVSISGSLWYDGFVDWVRGRTPLAGGYFISLGDREKNSKDKRMASVQDCTEQVVKMIGTEAGSSVKYLLEENTTHFSPIIPRLDKALEI